MIEMKFQKLDGVIYSPVYYPVIYSPIWIVLELKCMH